MNYFKNNTFIIVLFILVLLISCFSLLSHSHSSNFKVPSEAGYSGMAQIDGEHYLVVHDTKANINGPRLGIIQVKKEKSTKYIPLAISNWNDNEARLNDLESVCAIPGRPKEFLLAESGDRKGKYGRLFHIKLLHSGNNLKAKILGSAKLPIFKQKNGNQVGDNYEGIACAPLSDGTVLVILGERGGSGSYPNGVLRWAKYIPDSSKLIRSKLGDKGIIVKAPGTWIDPKHHRDIADLYLDSKGNLWAAGSEDGGDDGPFRSIIYKVATVYPDAEIPVEIVKPKEPSWILDGLKVEALGAPAAKTPESFLSFGTEDEVYGGIWRALYPPLDNV